jgi:hypothetical protein
MDTAVNPSSTVSRRPRWLRPGLLWFAADLLAPTALFYLLLWGGTSLYLALVASAGLSTVSALVSYRLGAGGQSFAPYMLALQLAAFGIALIAGSDRFLLAKESVLTALVGCWFIGSLWTARPLAYRFTRPLLEGAWGRRWGLTGGPTWETLWEREPRFRHIFRVSTAMWGVATLIDAVLRVVIAYRMPIASVVALQTAMFGVTILLMQVVTHVYYSRVGLWPMLMGYNLSFDPDQADPST